MTAIIYIYEPFAPGEGPTSWPREFVSLDNYRHLLEDLETIAALKGGSPTLLAALHGVGIADGFEIAAKIAREALAGFETTTDSTLTGESSDAG